MAPQTKSAMLATVRSATTCTGLAVLIGPR
ncbi:Uncharacterised protein [Bordetella pertussis]|nr:Uncharacterised protein [Bordetella pertussis]